MGLNVTNLLVGLGALAVGAFLTITGVGSALGVRLLMFGALTLFQTALGSKSGRDGFKNSPRYGWDNLQNVGTEGGPIPVCYGEDRYAPPVISVLPLMEGDVPVLYALYLVSHGPIEEIADVELNDTPISQFKGADFIAKLGTATQTQAWEKTVATDGTATTTVRFPGFDAIGRTFQAGTVLSKDAQHAHVMLQEADALMLSLTWPSGIYKVQDDGDVESWSAYVRVEYRKADAADSTYGPFSVPIKAGSTTKRQQGPWTEDGTAGTWILWKKTQSTYRAAIRLDFPSRGLWAVRITGLADNSSNKIRVPTLSTITEVVNDARAYAGYALLGLKLPPSEQLQGGLPRMTLRFKGRTLYDPRDTTTAFAKNPVLIALDLLTASPYGLGDRITLARCDVGVGGTFRTAADECDAEVSQYGLPAEAAFEWSGVLDTKAEAREWFTHILGTCHMGMFQSERLIKIARDRLNGTTSGTFEARRLNVSNRKNIVAAAKDGPGPGESSLVARSLPEANLPNVVRVSFMDRDDHYRRRVITTKNLSIAVGTATGTFTMGEALTSGDKKARFAGLKNGRLYYVQDSGATALASGDTLTGKTSGATVTTTAAPVTTPSPEMALEVNAAGITRRSQAVRLSRRMLNHALLTPVVASWKVFLGDLHHEPGDVVVVSDDDQGWTTKKFAVEGTTRDGDGFGDVIVREYDPDVYVDTFDQVPSLAAFVAPGGAVDPGLRDPAPSGGTGSSGTTTTPPSTGGGSSGSTPTVPSPAPAPTHGNPPPPPSTSSTSSKPGWSLFGNIFKRK